VNTKPDQELVRAYASDNPAGIIYHSGALLPAAHPMRAN